MHAYVPFQQPTIKIALIFHNWQSKMWLLFDLAVDDGDCKKKQYKFIFLYNQLFLSTHASI